MTNHTAKWTISCGLLLAAVCAGGADQAERAIDHLYRQYEQSFANKDVDAMFRNCDPTFWFAGPDGVKHPLDVNRREMRDALAALRSIHVTIQPEAKELLGDTFLVRYKQVHEIQFPLKPAPATTWFVAEDTWQRKNGEWRLMSTKRVSDSVSEWKQRVEVQKKKMEFEDEQRRSRNCMNGLGYGCGGTRQ